jgi:glycine/D-amino acid oxidase-like deaminating enzyme
MTAYGWWMQEALAAEPGFEPAPPLAGDATADVVIVGGGYTGLWTAWFLTERQPGIDVVVLEQEACGWGPSGRNGGFLNGWWDELPSMSLRHGPAAAVRACRELGASIRAIGEWCGANGVDAWFTDAGYLMVAAAPAQEGSWSRSVEVARDLGVGEELVSLSKAEVARRCRSPVFGGGAFMRDGGTVQPARLVLGLRRVLLERGVRIHEGSPVRRFRGGAEPVAATADGSVRAGHAVLALNAWAAAMPTFRRRLVTWGSHIVLTEPVPDLVDRTGWTGGECITDMRTAVHYFRTTPDGRIAFGGGGGRATTRLGPRLDDDPGSIRRAEEGFRRMFPALADVRIQQAWGGPIDVSPTHQPFFGSLPGGRAHYGLGYTGNGVAPSHLAGRILSALATGAQDDVLDLPMVEAPPRRFPPEPFRSAGARIVREAVVREERAHERGKTPGPLTRTAARLPRRMGYDLGPE